MKTKFPLFLSLFFLPTFLHAALPVTVVWEVRTTGNDSNGGGFDSAGSGTDYSQQDVRVASGTNLTVDAVTNTDVAPDGYTPISADVGNIIQITAGASYTTGYYEISSIVSGKWRLDRSPAGVGTTGGTWNLGGALATPGMGGLAMVGGNTLYVKSGTYTVTTAAVNVSSGCVSLPVGLVTSTTKLIGYDVTRGDDGTKPVFLASGITSFTFVTATTSAHLYIENIEFNGASLASSQAIKLTSVNALIVYLCRARNCKTNTFQGSSSSHLFILCEAINCTSAFVNASCYGCVARDATAGSTGFTSNVAGITLTRCIAMNLTTAGSVGFTFGNVGFAINCISYNVNGFSFVTGVAISQDFVFINDVAVRTTGFGFTATGVTDNVRVYNCAGWSNTSGDFDSSKIKEPALNFVNLTGDPFTNAAGGDFSLNNVGGAGAALRNAGIPAAGTLTQLPGISSFNYLDIGAVQSHALRANGAVSK